MNVEKTTAEKNYVLATKIHTLIFFLNIVEAAFNTINGQLLLQVSTFINE